MFEKLSLRILVADDSPDTVATLIELLQCEGHEARGVHRSVDVLGAERDFRPDVVILDLQMPDISGYDLARWLRSHYGARRPLLIAVSGAYTRPADKAFSQASGFDYYLAKPYSIRELISLISGAPRARAPSTRQ
jgi:DNA-binding response OmpR family regulator